MKIVLLHGQNHKGSTYQIARILVDKIERKAEISEFFFPKDLNHFCNGCYQCIQDESKCPFFEEKEQIMSAVAKADLLIFTTPTYCMHVSAPMKSFIDLTFTYWMSHRPRKSMFSKKTVILSTAAGMGTSSAIKDIRTCLTYWGISNVFSYGVSVQAMNWNGVSEKKKKQINEAVGKLAKKVNKSTKHHTSIKTKGTFYLMRMMQKNNWGSGEEEKKYWQENGWLDKARPWK